MKNIWKNVLGVALIAAISSGAAIGTSTYLMNKNQRPAELASGVENTFKQPYRLTNYGTVAAENIDFTTAAESAIHGVVHIKATANAQASNGDGGQQYMDPFEYFFGFGGRGGFQRPQQQPRVGAGSGVIISTDGYIITNNHVIDGADELEVTLNDNRKFPAKIIGADPTTDIALIRSQCGQEITDASWKMVFAQDEAEFDRLWEEMKGKLEGLGWDTLVEFDMEKYQKMIDARVAAME